MSKARIHEIADYLATAFGGRHAPANRDGEFVYWYAIVIVPPVQETPGYQIGLTRSGYGAQAGKITATLSSHPDSGRTDKRINWPSAAFNEARDLQAIAADVSRRVVNTPAAQKALAEHAAAVAEQSQRDDAIGSAVNMLRKAAPFRESHNFPRDNYRARIFSEPGGTFFDCEVRTDSVNFTRIGSMSIDKAARILAILAEGDNE